MRNLVFALVAALAASLATFAPSEGVPAAGAASTGPKVVIIVGAVHGSTTTYRTRADAAYAEAIRYSSNVVKVYSPNATWANVKAAIQGASVVIYMGHGNGFPSPYRTSPWPYSQNGFGLNQVAGQGDYNVQYYGEHYIGGEVTLAPNAVVLLHHLCYASGNGEPGQAEPTVDVAKQRADNYAAGFLKAGARAVIADGHMGPAYYIRSLFTTHQTIDQMWRASPNYHANAFKFASVRSPGYTVQMDLVQPTSGFLRSVSGNLALTTDQVTGASVAPAGGDPLSSVAASPARFYPHDEDRFAPTTTLSFTLARTATVTWRVTTADGTPVRTRYERAALAAGTYRFAWDGRQADGTFAPKGRYLSVVEATDGQQSYVQRVWVEANAFRIRSSDTTPARGQQVTITATSSEPLSSGVRLGIRQPDIAPYAVVMTRVSDLSYQATVTLRRSSAGPISFRVSALDADGRSQATRLIVPLQ